MSSKAINKPIKLLLIEGNPEDARFIDEVVSSTKKASFQIEVAENLSHGLKALSGNGFNAVLLNPSLPDSSGLETLTAVNAKAQQTAIIVLGTSSDEDLALRALRKGAQDYLLKDEMDPISLPRAIIKAMERKKSEMALRESEESFRRGLELALNPIGITRFQDGSFMYVNKAFSKLFGYRTEEIIGRTPFEVNLYEDPTDRERLLEGLRKHGRVDGLEIRYRVKDGTVKDYLVSARPLRFQGEDCLVVVAPVVTSLKKAQLALQESEEKYRSIIESIEDGYYEVDVRGNFTLVNDSLCKIHRRNRDEMIGMNNRDYMDKENAEKVYGAFNKVYTTGKPYRSIQYEIIRKDGARRHIETSVSLIKDKNDRAIGFRGTTRDRTDLWKVERALREGEEKYRNILESIEDGYFENDIRGNFTFVNDSLCRMFGYSRDEIIGMNYRNYMDQENAEKIYQAYNRVYTTGKAERQFQCEAIAKDGAIKHVENSITLIKDEEGHSTGFRGIMRDITEHKLAEEEKRRLEAQLQQSQKMEAIGSLAGGIAHDFNNILGIIVGNTELAIDDVPEWNPARHNLLEVRSACLRAKDIVRQILSFSRQTDVERKPVEISETLKESVKLLRASIPSTIEIRQNISDESHMVMADPTQVNQVLLNLCTNATYAMREGGGILEVSLTDVMLDEETASQYQGLSPGEYIKLSVQDTGPGIDPAIMERIFNPYFTTKAVGEGTGMGLAVAHGIVRGHGGGIAVESRPGRGTTFNVYLPVTEAVKKPEEKAEESIPTGKECILFIDDEEALIKIGKRMLEHLGYGVVSKISSVEALELFRAEPDQFDLVITDMTMPGMTGDELAEEVMKIRPDIPVILCTGFSERISEEVAIDMGVKAFIMKPLILRDFANTVRKVLDEEGGIDGGKR